MLLIRKKVHLTFITITSRILNGSRQRNYTPVSRIWSIYNCPIFDLTTETKNKTKGAILREILFDNNQIQYCY